MFTQLFALEHGKAAYLADYLLYGAAVVGLSAGLLFAGPAAHVQALLLITLGGLFAWTAVEYLMHRFLLHRVAPFSRWHAEHHLRPTARIGSPTVISATLFVTLVFLPAWALAGVWPACALTLGMVAGYFGYALTHHATHHWRADGAWLRRRKTWHALHHHRVQPGCYGVTTSLWDHVLGTAPTPATERSTP